MICSPFAGSLASFLLVKQAGTSGNEGLDEYLTSIFSDITARIPLGVPASTYCEYLNFPSWEIATENGTTFPAILIILLRENRVIISKDWIDLVARTNKNSTILPWSVYAQIAFEIVFGEGCFHGTLLETVLLSLCILQE